MPCRRLFVCTLASSTTVSVSPSEMPTTFAVKVTGSAANAGTSKARSVRASTTQVLIPGVYCWRVGIGNRCSPFRGQMHAEPSV